MPNVKLRVAAVAKKANLTTSRVNQLEREGRIRAERDSNGWRLFDEAEVDRFIRARENRRRQSAETLDELSTKPTEPKLATASSAA